jgi:hypothetical protein
MDETRFDELTRVFASGATRRTVLRGMVAALAATVGLHTAARAAAVKRKPGEVCRKTGECVEGASCVKDETGRSRCTCRPAWTLCNESCVQTPEDVNNCGACGNVCPASADSTKMAVCNQGTCGIACAAGYEPCGELCIPNDGCCTHADCNDGKACTVSLCGPESHTCTHIPITANCVECGSDGDCGGGSCCHGRCCPAGAGCQQAATGEPICCPNCPGGSCCDDIIYSTQCIPGDGCYIDYQIGEARCFPATTQEPCTSCLGYCSTHTCAGYLVLNAGSGICGLNNSCSPNCVAPIGRFA